MRAILIDPTRHAVEEVEYSGDYKEIYKLLDIQVFTVVHFGQGDVYVDDEGLLKDNIDFFQIEGYAQPLAGKGLILGTPDEEGNETPATVSLEWARANIDFFVLLSL